MAHDVRGGHDAQPYLVIRPTAGWRAIDVRELWRYRGLLAAMTRRDVTIRYRQTLLGVVWILLQPLLAAGIFAFVFGSVAHLSSNGVPYLVFAYTGLLGFNAFALTLNSMSTSLLTNAGLVSKTYFPRSIVPISQLGSKLLDLVVTLGLFVILDAAYGLGVRLSMLTLPLWLLVLYALTLGLGLLTSAANVAYRDVGYVVPVALNMLLYLSPVAYGVSHVPGHLRLVYTINPLVPMINGVRWSLLGTDRPSLGATAYGVGAALVLLVVGVLYFRAHERRFADVI